MVRKGLIKKQGTNKQYERANQMKFWTNGKIEEVHNNISSMNYGLHYASPSIWEGVRAYKQADGSTKIFKLQEHMQRLKNSAKIVGIEIPYSLNEMMDACLSIVEANGGGDLYLRPIVYPLMLAEAAKPREMKVAFDVYAIPVPPLHSGKQGIKCIVSSRARGYPQFQMQAKTAANYSVLQLVKTEIDAARVDEALLVDNAGYITEATVANILVVKGDVIMTPPNDGSILPGLTRQTMFEILTDPTKMFVKYKKAPIVVEKKITRADLYTADCVMLCGTYAEVVLVKEIDSRSIGSEDTYGYFKILKAEYEALVRGRNG